ncbi:MAG: cysteine desulfurase [Candidatus Latescibacterota bacterium]|nr:MAG: cysteine desulfurase [Candidatus Latescibacterota bacterium]
MRVHGKPLVYLDNAASTQKPYAVIDAYNVFYSGCYSNIHRGVYHLSETATRAYEDAREKARAFINAARVEEIVFVRGTTEGINLVAQTFGRSRLRAGDEVLITWMEHHSNIVPWQMVCEATGAVLRVVPIDDRGDLMMDEFEKLIGPRTKIVGVVHVSNALGTVNPVKEIVRLAHARGVPVLIDGAQAVAHTMVDVRDLDCDFYVFSGHKLFGPTGIGVLYGKKKLLDEMPPYQGGGDMIRSVTFEKTTYNEAPYRFEAGTPNIAGAIGLGAAIDYVEGIGRDTIEAYERGVFARAAEALEEIPGLRLIGTARERTSVLSFVMDGVHPHDIGTILDREGIAVRTGHHCAQPVVDRFGVAATARASLALYNTNEEVDALVRGLGKVREVLS